MSKITVEQQGHVLLLGLNRPDKMNAFDVEMYMLLAEGLGKLDRDSELRCGLIYARGQHFTSGLDMAKWIDVFSAGSFPELAEGSCDPLGPDRRP
ncbi:MAG: hypothetical protein R6U91_01200 [Bacillota bacterium]